MGVASPGQVGLSCVRVQAEQVMRSNPVMVFIQASASIPVSRL